MQTDKVRSPKELVEYFQYLWNSGQYEKLSETFAPNLIFHHGNAVMSTEQFLSYAKEIKKAFPDNKIEIEDMIIEGNKVAVRYKATGTMTGEFFGMPATNKKYSITILEIDVVENGKFVESWAVQDTLDYMRQLGLM